MYPNPYRQRNGWTAKSWSTCQIIFERKTFAESLPKKTFFWGQNREVAMPVSFQFCSVFFLLGLARASECCCFMGVSKKENILSRTLAKAPGAPLLRIRKLRTDHSVLADDGEGGESNC